MPYDLYCLTPVLVTPNGGANPIMPVSYMTPVSAPVLVAFPLSSPLVCLYCFPLPSPCTLGQQVIPYCLPSHLIVLGPYCLA